MLKQTKEDIIMKVIATDKAPAAIGPYSQGLEHGNMVFVSGQIPVDPATGEKMCIRDRPDGEPVHILQPQRLLR